MTLSRSQKTIRLSLVIVLILLIFMPAQIPIASLKIGFIVALGLMASALQFIILRQTHVKNHRIQGIMLMVLTLIICVILLLI
jgi:hypothetical protein